jgi:hypothetical protein
MIKKKGRQTVQKPTIAIISACMSILILTSNGYANHQGLDCSVCHDDQATRNLSNIREVIETPNSGPREVWFTAYEGWHSFADGDPAYDGICEVCHTNTLFHRNDGTGAPGHHTAQDCRPCHLHENDFLGSFPGAQSHETHLTQYGDPKGPGMVSCDWEEGGCHTPGDFSKFGPSPGQFLNDTDVCNPCHSPDGVYDGVNDPAIGAKPNWQDGVYEETGDALKSGKEDWCAGCHDDGIAVINGVSAPNVMGDNVTYGYNASGHGRQAFGGIECVDCHDLIGVHVDGNARTYSAAMDNYRLGYRLNEDLTVPRNGEDYPQAFRLCTNCHLYSQIIGPDSNFRDDVKGFQYHEKHLEDWPTEIASDSDFDGTGCSTGTCRDSAITCIICHNVHGSLTPAMIRHGELISTPGTTDKVPALDFQWYKADGSTPTSLINESRFGSLVCGGLPDVSVNHVCAGCHVTGRLYYYRTPTPCQCNLVPDATIIPRGGTLGFDITVTNNTDEVQLFGFATYATKPGGGKYPPFGYLIGPVRVSLNPYGSKSAHRSHSIPGNVPLGTYTYYGVVGTPGAGLYDRCQFDFEVVEP